MLVYLEMRLLNTAHNSSQALQLGQTAEIGDISLPFRIDASRHCWSRSIECFIELSFFNIWTDTRSTHDCDDNIQQTISDKHREQRGISERPTLMYIYMRYVISIHRLWVYVKKGFIFKCTIYNPMEQVYYMGLLSSRGFRLNEIRDNRKTVFCKNNLPLNFQIQRWYKNSRLSASGRVQVWW